MSPRYVYGQGRQLFVFVSGKRLFGHPEENIISMHFCTAQIYLQFCASSATYLYEDHFDIHTSKNQLSLRATPDDSVAMTMFSNRELSQS